MLPVSEKRQRIIATAVNRGLPCEEVAETLENAADLLRTVGWCKGVSVRRDELGAVIGYCAMGALAKAAETPSNSRSLLVSASAAALSFEVGTGNIPDWNDFRARGAEEVIDMMLSAAKELRNV